MDLCTKIKGLFVIQSFSNDVPGDSAARMYTGLDFSVPLAKTLMLANMLAFAGKGAYSFDGEKTDSAVANAHASRPYRRGWEVA